MAAESGSPAKGRTQPQEETDAPRGYSRRYRPSEILHPDAGGRDANRLRVI